MSKREFHVRDAVAEGLLRRGCKRSDDTTDRSGQWVFLHPDGVSKFFLTPMGSLRQGPDFKSSRALTNSLGYAKLKNEGAIVLSARLEKQLA